MGGYYAFALVLVAVVAVNALCVKWIDKNEELDELKRRKMVYGWMVDDIHGLIGVLLSIIWLVVHLLAAYMLNVAFEALP